MDENIMGDEDLNTSRLTFLASSTNQKKILKPHAVCLLIWSR